VVVWNILKQGAGRCGLVSWGGIGEGWVFGLVEFTYIEIGNNESQ